MHICNMLTVGRYIMNLDKRESMARLSVNFPHCPLYFDENSPCWVNIQGVPKKRSPTSNFDYSKMT